jgi:hypothetical protein
MAAPGEWTGPDGALAATEAWTAAERRAVRRRRRRLRRAAIVAEIVVSITGIGGALAFFLHQNRGIGRPPASTAPAVRPGTRGRP